MINKKFPIDRIKLNCDEVSPTRLEYITSLAADLGIKFFAISGYNKTNQVEEENF